MGKGGGREAQHELKTRQGHSRDVLELPGCPGRLECGWSGAGKEGRGGTAGSCGELCMSCTWERDVIESLDSTAVNIH